MREFNRRQNDGFFSQKRVVFFFWPFQGDSSVVVFLCLCVGVSYETFVMSVFVPHLLLLKPCSPMCFTQTHDTCYGKRADIACAKNTGLCEPMLFAYIAGRPKESFSQGNRHVALLRDWRCPLKVWFEGKSEDPFSGDAAHMNRNVRNVPSNMCAHRRFRSDSANAQTDLNLHWALFG